MKTNDRKINRRLTGNEKAYLTKNMIIEKRVVKGLFWLFSFCFVAISIGVIVLFLEGDIILSIIVCLFNLLFLWLALICRKFRRADLTTQDIPVVCIAGNFRQEFRGHGRSRRVYYYLNDECINLPAHWLKYLKIGDWVDAEVFPLGKQSAGSSILLGEARWSVLAIENLSSIDREVPLGLLDMKNASLPLFGVIISLVLIFALGGVGDYPLYYFFNAIILGKFFFLSPLMYFLIGLCGVCVVSLFLSITRIIHNKTILERIKESSITIHKKLK